MSAANLEFRADAPVFTVIPIGLFGSVMGLTGLSVAWQFASNRYDLGPLIANGLAALAVLAFLVLAGAYAMKIVRSPDRVRAEFDHPSGSSLFGTALISLLLLPIVLAPVSQALACAVWGLGAVGMATFAWVMVDRWLSRPQPRADVSPAWIVPVVGMLDVPLAVPVLGLPQLEAAMVVGLAIGLFFAVPLFTLIFARLLFETPLPPALQPTLLILVAPFSVGCSAYVATTGHVDLFAESLFALAVFVLLIFSGRLRELGQCCPFRFSWWAVSFPLAATTIAAFRVAAEVRNWAMDSLALFLLATTTVVVAWLLWRTLSGIARGELRELAR